MPDVQGGADQERNVRLRRVHQVGPLSWNRFTLVKIVIDTYGTVYAIQKCCACICRPRLLIVFII